MTGRRRVGVVFPAGQGVADWERRQAADPVPSRWPYGLDLLGSDRVEVSPRATRSVDRFTRLALAAPGLDPRALRRLRRPGDDPLDTALCWDENTALAMVTQVAADRYCGGVIWVTDAAEQGTSRRYLAAVRTALRGMDALWVLSRPQVGRLSEWLGAGAPPVHFVRFGVDTAYYRPTPYPSAPVITSFGNDRDRDVDTLYAALALVRAKRPDVRCVVQTNSSRPVPEGVVAHERLPHAGIRDLLAESSVVAIATRPNWHVSGMTVALEAGASARPVVACRTPGMEDYVHDGVTGELVEPGDADVMAGRILDLIADPARAAELGRAARVNVAAAHSTVTMADALRQIAAPGA